MLHAEQTDREAGGLEEGAWVKLWGWWTTHKVSMCVRVHLCVGVCVVCLVCICCVCYVSVIYVCVCSVSCVLCVRTGV